MTEVDDNDAAVVETNTNDAVQPGKTLKTRQNKKAAAQLQTKEALENPTGTSGQILKAHIERIERMNEEMLAHKEDLRDHFTVIKSQGFDSKIIKKIVKMRKSNVEKRREEQELLELYMSAIGMTE